VSRAALLLATIRTSAAVAVVAVVAAAAAVVVVVAVVVAVVAVVVCFDCRHTDTDTNIRPVSNQSLVMIYSHLFYAIDIEVHNVSRLPRNVDGRCFVSLVIFHFVQKKIDCGWSRQAIGLGSV
jgi:hypothetical protein